MDEVLRNKLWTAISIAIFFEKDRVFLQGSPLSVVYNRIWIHFFGHPIDNIPPLINTFKQNIRDWFFKATWYEVYDFIEALAHELTHNNLEIKEHFVSMVNDFLEGEMSAYRLIGDGIGEITSTEEIAAIEEAVERSEPMAPVHLHLRDALTKLTNRSKPDYRNSIKESISAVESICRLITKDSSATLGTALKKLEESGIRLHPALAKAWSNLYGYTNDANGIRHALFDEPHNTFGEAKYILVSCSAFINYLLELTKTAKIAL